MGKRIFVGHPESCCTILWCYYRIGFAENVRKEKSVMKDIVCVKVNKSGVDSLSCTQCYWFLSMK